MDKSWKTGGAIVLAGALIASAIYAGPMIGEQEIQLSEQERLRVDAASGMSQACTTSGSGGERCVTLSNKEGRFLPHITQEMREVGVRDTVRAKLRGE